MEIKPLTAKRLAKQDRDLQIKLFYQALPVGLRSLRHIAAVFGVSKSTVHYAVMGRRKKKG